MYDRLRKTNNYLSWVLSAVLRHPDILKQCMNIPELKIRAQKLKVYHLEKYNTFDSTEHAMFSLSLTNDKVLEENIPNFSYNNELLDSSIQKQYDSYEYPYDIESKDTIAVTALQKLADDHYLDLSKEDEDYISGKIILDPYFNKNNYYQ